MEGNVKIITRNLLTTLSIERWVVLDVQTLYIFAKFDVAQNLNLKRSVSLTNASVRKSSNKSNILEIIPFEKSEETVVMDCSNFENSDDWFKSLSRAVGIHKEDEISFRMVQESCALLRLNSDDVSKQTISRAYKRLALSWHPDRFVSCFCIILDKVFFLIRGGTTENFEKLNRAYHFLMAVQANIDEEFNCRMLEYDVVIVKSEEGVGLTLFENRIRDRVVVEAVGDVHILELGADGGGSILPGDALVKIDDDVCSSWLLSRVKARLGPERVQVGSQVQVKTF